MTADPAAKPGTVDDSAGAAYGGLIAGQLAEERATKTSLEQRGNFIITSSGVLVTLLFGLAAMVTSEKTFSVPAEARSVLAAAVIFFVLAALGGLAANLPWRYQEVSIASMGRLLEERYWRALGSIGSRRVGEVQLAVLDRARTANRSKSLAVTLGLASEMVAVTLVSVAVAIVLV